MSKVKQWTKRCDRGADCIGARPDVMLEGYYVPDDQDICNACLLSEYDLLGKATYDQCSDPWSIYELYREEDVLKALRKARS